ncbi:RsmB/NOP family class I SAM-dependent RNA methyltransferase [Yoonia sp. SS1-5]|uniref:RsmB/NOP family class I SAM-dependent RNA methyltransferase n=1 Tax=Yoonia rhodophyticola TaxID=3137370 RepID=A0AAN0M8H5_9RHOB
MTPGARIAAAIDVIDAILAGASPEQVLKSWARASRFAGSKDRAAIRDHVFDVLRAKRSLAARGGAMTGRGLMLGLCARDGADLRALWSGAGHGPSPLSAAEAAYLAQTPDMSQAEAHDIPDWLWPLWTQSLDANAAPAAQALQRRAPIFLRINTKRTTPADAVASLAQDDIDAVQHPDVSSCLEVRRNPRRIKLSQAYQSGLIELQDAASQLAVAAIPVPDQGRVLDYCAGGGGKALAFADLRKATVFAHDIAAARMADLQPRAERAGVKIAAVATKDLARFEPYDVVFCDAPCSGSGTWRRTPDAKWQLTAQMLDQYHAMQDDVLSRAVTLVKPQGSLVYATCSVLKSENSQRVAAFQAQHPDWHVVAERQLIPGPKWDGFYYCLLQKQKHNL